MAKEIDPRDYMAEFLAAGGTVKQIPLGEKTDPAVIVHTYGRPKKKVEPVVVKEVKPKKEKKASK
jgi:predicted mannosyl-3-phosphoglycerate phosphatase (HAD superfamily)